MLLVFRWLAGVVHPLRGRHCDLSVRPARSIVSHLSNDSLPRMAVPPAGTQGPMPISASLHSAGVTSSVTVLTDIPLTLYVFTAGCYNKAIRLVVLSLFYD